MRHRKIKKTEVDVRSANAKKFMAMFDKGEIPEGMSASDRITLEKDAELQMMRTKKRGERDFFKKLENGDAKDEAPKEPKLLVGKLKVSISKISERVNTEKVLFVLAPHGFPSQYLSFCIAKIEE